jgi:hypothetical protein
LLLETHMMDKNLLQGKAIHKPGTPACYQPKRLRTLTTFEHTAEMSSKITLLRI